MKVLQGGELLGLGKVVLLYQQDEGQAMSLDELVLVLLSKLFSWFRDLLSRSRNFLEHAGGEIFLLVFSIV